MKNLFNDSLLGVLGLRGRGKRMTLQQRFWIYYLAYIVDEELDYSRFSLVVEYKYCPYHLLSVFFPNLAVKILSCDVYRKSNNNNCWYFR